MGSSKISALAAVEELDGTESLLAVKGSGNVRLLSGQLAEYVEAQVAAAIALAQTAANDANAAAGEAAFNTDTLRETHARLRRIASGESNVRYSIATIGDSYVDGDFWVPTFAKALQDQYGFAGLGWVGFGWFGAGTGPWVKGGLQPTTVSGCARPDLSPRPVIIGAWTCTYRTPSLNLPTMAKVVASTAGNQIEIAYPGGCSYARLWYTGTGTGVIRHSWDGGSTWQANTALNNSGPTAVLLSAFPVGGAGNTLVIEVVSGTVELAGIEINHGANSGVIVNKMGASGSTAADWAAISASFFQVAMQIFGVNAITAGFGPNEQTLSHMPTHFRTQLEDIAATFRTANSVGDVLLMVAPENQRPANAVAMVDYAAAAKDLARDERYAFLNLQPVFGDDKADYAWANTARQWIGADLLHLTPTGGKVYADAVLRTLLR